MTPLNHTRRRRALSFRRCASLLAALAVLSLAAACSSSSSSSSSSVSSGAASSSSGSSSGLSAADQAGLTKAQAFVTQYEQRPTQITDVTKVTGTIPKNKLIDFIPCGAVPECLQEGNIVKQAGAMLGWTTKILSNDGSPQQSKAAFEQVVRDKAAAVLYTAIPASTFSSLLPQLHANGTFISTCCVTDPVGASTGIDYSIDDLAQVGPIAGAQAAWVATDSKDTANSLYMNIPDFAILNTQFANFKSGMATYCPSCQVSELDIALANIGTGPSTIVSYLRAHPSVNYVVASTDSLTVGLPAALKAAGLNTKVKIVGQGATPVNLQYLHSGQEAADVAFPYFEAMYSMVSAVFQHYAGQQVTPSVAPPLWILTPQNAPTATEAFPVVVAYQSQYGTLWGVSS
jgi:ribose transport system substrate-binding protein